MRRDLPTRITVKVFDTTQVNSKPIRILFEEKRSTYGLPWSTQKFEHPSLSTKLRVADVSMIQSNFVYTRDTNTCLS